MLCRFSLLADTGSTAVNLLVIWAKIVFRHSVMLFMIRRSRRRFNMACWTSGCWEIAKWKNFVQNIKNSKILENAVMSTQVFGLSDFSSPPCPNYPSSVWTYRTSQTVWMNLYLYIWSQIRLITEHHPFHHFTRMLLIGCSFVLNRLHRHFTPLTTISLPSVPPSCSVWRRAAPP